MTPTRYPGFSNVTFGAQQTFRALLHALSHPGQPVEMEVRLGHPEELHPACAAACLTLLDIDTQVWIQPEFGLDVKDWLVFHTGCRFVEHPYEADFALVNQAQSSPSLNQFNPGSPEFPEQSTTVLVQVAGVDAGESAILRGPGIKTQQAVRLSVLPDRFWSEWEENTRSYPLGIDMLWFCERQVIGLPRTSRVTAVPQATTEVATCLT